MRQARKTAAAMTGMHGTFSSRPATHEVQEKMSDEMKDIKRIEQLRHQQMVMGGRGGVGFTRKGSKSPPRQKSVTPPRRVNETRQKESGTEGNMADTEGKPPAKPPRPQPPPKPTRPFTYEDSHS